ncbi:CAP domain-containing protein [Candidatus Pacebacteria bacterium]|nr:CAP domain-containing protein [Candidatus Paceibacterota bacterium]
MRRNLKNYFIPHEGNDHKPHSLREKSIIYFLVIALVFELGFLSILFSPLASSFKDNLAAILPQVLVLATNEERQDRNLGMLNTNEKLVLAAQLKADDMAEREFFAHVNPDGNQPWYYIQQAGYEFDAAGENLAVNFIDSDDVHRAWMKSPTHKANIVQNKFTEIGIATSRGRYEGKDVIFVAQFFATPKTQETNIKKQDTNNIQIAKTPTTPTPTDNDTKDQEEVVLAIPDTEIEDDSQILGAETESEVEIYAEIEDSPKEDDITEQSEEIDKFDKLFSSPRSIITFVISLIFIIVALALILKVFIKINIQHKQLIVYGVLLILIAISMLIFNEQIIVYMGKTLAY